MTLPTGSRRRLPLGGTTRTAFVDHWPADPAGDLMSGFVRVPIYLVGAKEHTKERHEFLKLIGENVKRWSEWKAKKGWFINSTPSVAGPFDPPTERTGGTPIDAAYPEHKRYVVTARFKRETPEWLPIDGARWLRDQADLYAVDLRDSSELKDTEMNEGKDEIIDSNPDFHDPMKFAAERREWLGLKREDFLLDELSAPL